MLKPSINNRDNISGPDNAIITLVEYGDYECPHCGRAHGIIKNIQVQMEGILRFVFRNFPLQESHPNAFMAAVATEAAARQKAFWPMHNVIFENQERLSHDDLEAYAGKLKLNLKTFDIDMKDEALKEKVEADFESGVMSGVNGTPTFFINGTRYDGNWEEIELLKVLNKMAQK
ncbi:MAG: thioredoxin domain-containing protein [Rhizobacter sp.]|nr:thioredoxin domain-containing protein [Ferruginibacter sp.]